ncbi:MAG: isochorismate synthase [Chlorobium sp.]|jgi:menaquinone-specific isochorismate synthase|uniref:isochorismate synthase n=1 Tax=Chlorobium sp. TaxID=1095 RepID=UPI0025C5E5F1|nr:isochorismate synthase [Chlorobium sp.]MCF8216091.1 isochorismate synthase [Chlorobium sp.]MCF8270992.1 isochorismate synthase [Chlorobium sp.]MCF8287362.1 isochorismate synthase [Chlorobium sp.]MCF8290905.1 isochorismate synthase [Chlorobium sp.]MCF8385000.1 isochorismate synthase [Chlorobium sp.]
MTEQQNNIIIPDQDSLSIEKAVTVLRNAIAARSRSTTLPLTPGLYTFSQPIKPIDPLHWLESQRLFPRAFWMNREKSYTIAGIGAADSIGHDERCPNTENFELLISKLSKKNPAARYLGGFRFNSIEKHDGTWDAFPAFSFVLPLVQLTEEQGSFRLTSHLWIEKASDAEKKADILISALAAIDSETGLIRKKPLPELKKVVCIPDRKIWTERCEKALNLFESEEMQKIMLARQTVLQFESSFSPLLFLINYPYPQNATYRFAFEPEENLAFISFTPERLYRRDGQTILTEALAGTFMKETINGSDKMASEMLLNSEKDIREHAFVKDTIYQELQSISSLVKMEDNLRVLQLNRLAHLYTRCTATLKPECSSDSTVLSLLHPTPAVGGVPKDAAMEKIMQLEPFCRGWYAAPVGWISRDSAEFSVGIRSALVNGTTTSLYSGAGLVKGSDPDLEWQEIEEKIGDIMAITRLHV